MTRRPHRTAALALALVFSGVLLLASGSLAPASGRQQQGLEFRAHAPMVGRDVVPAPQPTPTPIPPTPTPVPQPTGVGVRNASWYVSSTGSVWVVGEVYNGLGEPVEFVRVTANFYSSGGTLLATDFGFSDIDTMPAGTDSPFSVLLFDPPAGITSVSVQVTDYDTDPFFPPAVGLAASVTNVYTSSIGTVHVVGTVTNTSGFVHEFVQIFVAFYGPDGRVTRTDFTFSEPDTLGPGQSGTFDILVFDGPPALEGAPRRIWVDGNRE